MIRLPKRRFDAGLFIGLLYFVTLFTNNNSVLGVSLRGGDDDRQQQMLRDLEYIDINGKPMNKKNNNNDNDDFEILRNGPFLYPEQIEISENLKEPVLKNGGSGGDDKDVITSRIVGGSEMNEPYSFFAMLLHHDGMGWKWAGCGATLVSNCHVLSAAHCMLDRDINVRGVYVNAYRPFESNSGHPYHFSLIANTITRDDYDDDTNIADISIIKMENCLDVNLYPIAEPAHPDYAVNEGIMVNILGFGKMSEQATSLNRVRTLRIATMPYIPRSRCADTYYGSHIKQDMVCAGFDEGGVDACQGDSGSGLMYYDPNKQKWIHLGIVSWGVGCGRRARPGVYSSIQHYFFWLWEEVCLDNDTSNNVNWCAYRSYTNRQDTQPTTVEIPTDSPTCIPAHNECGATVSGIATDCCSGSCWRGRCLPSKAQAVSNHPSFANGKGGAGGGQHNSP